MLNRAISGVTLPGVKVILAVVAGFAVVVPGFADDKVIEQVVVTGTRIKSSAGSSQPLTSLGGDQLNQSGELDIGEILNDTPSLLSSTTSTNSIDSSASNIGASVDNFGGSALNLRGLGYKRTLTLVNGRRHVAGVEGTSAVDIGTIPTALIDRVEVLSGGASAVYGADAVTGVVNVVLKDHYEGMQFDVSSSDAKAYGTDKMSMVFGKNFANDRGNVIVGLMYDEDSGLKMGERSFLANNGIYDNDVNPALRFQQGEISQASTPNLYQYYNYGNTGLFPWGLRIPSQSTFMSDYQSAFGNAAQLTDAEKALFERGATAPPQAILPGRTFNITAPYGLVSIGDFGLNTALGSEPDLDGNGTPDCLDSFTGYNSSLDGAASFGLAGGCWVIDQNGNLGPYHDGLVASSFNQFGASQSYIRPNETSAIPAKKQYSINVNGTFQVTDSVELFLESKYVRQKFNRTQQYDNYTDLLYGAPDNPFLPAALKAYASNGGVPFVDGFPNGLHMSRDSQDWGPNVSTNKRTTTRFVFGARGSLMNLDYEVSANYGKFERHLYDREAMIPDRFFAAIDVVTDPATGQPVCRSDLDPAANPLTTPFNIFEYVGGAVPSSFFTFTPGDGQCKPMNIWGGRQAFSQQAIDFISYTREVKESIEQNVFNGFVSGNTESWFSLPAGPIDFVMGMEYRKEKNSQNFDALDQGILPQDGVTADGTPFSAGQWVGEVSAAQSLGAVPSTRLLSSSSSYHFFDWFTEVSAPLLADVPGARELTASAAFRRSDNSTFGANDTYKVGLVWAPIEDITFRANYSEAVRVPNLFELYSPEQGTRFRPLDPCSAQNISTALDPAVREQNCASDLAANNVSASSIYDADGNYVFEDPLSAGFPGAVGGNADLHPETGKTLTYGVIITPRFAPQFSLTVDMINIEIEDAILPVSAQNIVDRCYDSPTLNNQFCSLISRNDNPTSAQSGGLDYLRQVQLNFGAAKYKGTDISARYNFSTSEFNINMTMDWTHVAELNLIQKGTGSLPDTIDPELGEMRRPMNSAVAGITLSRGDFDINWKTSYYGKQTLTYEDGVEIETVYQNYGPSAFTPTSTFVHDLSANYRVGDILLYGGVNNVTDLKPYVTERAYPVSPVGRLIFVGLKYSFY